MAAHNAAGMVRAALGSKADQTFSELFEVITADNASAAQVIVIADRDDVSFPNRLHFD